ncbi:hypothetical protein D9Q98_008467 [Chlorella vulgaris]|uniref:Prolyl endopeptidase-like n=1 Tax=Chlorella vulgaris TaxID=3077 RepID=A0A9D4TGP9_CHLVU|nr:hypothetical protein D9Q98_008467 [Chlorella vulgaris]
MALASTLRCASCRSTQQQSEGVCAGNGLDLSVPVPKTTKQSLTINAPGTIDAPPRVDEYAWLRDDARNNSAVLSHLQEENAYAQAVLGPSLPLQQRLLQEMLARVPAEESSVPQRSGRHWYYSVHSAGMQYRRFCRRLLDDPGAAPSEHDGMNMTQPEDVLLDQDELARSHKYFDMAGPSVSMDEQLLAYAVDTAGNEVFTLYVLNLTSGIVRLDGGREELYPPEFRLCVGDMVWLNDNRTLLFTTLTEDTHRADKVWSFDAMSDPSRLPHGLRFSPQLLYHEPDEAFHLGLWRSRSDAVVYLRGRSGTTHYLLYLPTDGSSGEGGNTANFTSLAPKVHEQQYLVRDAPPRADSPAYLYAVIYTAEQRNGQLVVVELGPDALLNATADSSGVRSAPNPGDGAAEANSTSAAGDGDGVSDSESSGGGEDVEQGGSGGGGTEASHSYWALLQAHSREVELVDITVSSSHLAVLERKNGTLVATAYPLPKDGQPLAVLRNGLPFTFDAPSYSLEFGDQGPFASDLLRVRYSSLTQPSSTYDINMASGNRVLKQQQEVLGFDGSQYLSRLLWATSADGAQVPISLAYRGELVRLDGSDPLLLEAYGAYGASLDPQFSGAQLSLLDRGFICAIAHVRGGGELGRYWYQDGKLLAKNHTFDDAVAAAEFLIKSKYTSAEGLAMWGRSAGGLTVGATVNRRPELFKSAILDVPFVDVLSTMSDPSLPLTVTEWEEWGDPTSDQAAFDNMLSYSPLDNVAAQPYPHLLLTGGLNDPRVSYWEPAKMAAKVRQLKTGNDSLVLLQTNMAAGHFASSGLAGRLRDQAFKFAFLLQTVAPCALVADEHTELAARCRGCFAALVGAATTIALVTLVMVLRPSSRIARKWARLNGWHGEGRRRGLSGEEEDDEEEDGGQGFDTRLYSAHMGARGATEVAEAAEEGRQRQLRQLQAQGLSLESYDAVRDTVRDKLLPIPGPPSAALSDAKPQKKRRPAPVTLDGGAAEGGAGIELSQLNVRQSPGSAGTSPGLRSLPSPRGQD